MNQASSSQKMGFLSLIKAIWYITHLAWKANSKAVVGLGFSQILSALTPLVIAFLSGALLTQITIAISTKNIQPVLILFGVSFFVVVIQSFAGALTNYFSTHLQFAVENYATQTLMQKYASLSMEQRENREIADLFEQAETFTSRAHWIFERGIRIFANIVLLIGTMIALSSFNVWLGLAILIALIPSFTLQLYSNKYERKFWKKNSISRRIAWEYRKDILHLQSLSELRLGGLVPLFVTRWRDKFTKDRREQMALEKRILPFNFLASLTEGIATIGAVLWTVLQIIAGALPLGAFLTVQQLVGSAQGAITSLIWMLASISQEILNTHDFYDFMKLNEESRGGLLIPTTHIPRIEFKNVTFTYPQADAPTLHTISFVIEPSESVALVGENGSGKSTIIKLLLGFYEPDSGEILINDQPLNTINKDSWYRHIGVLFQDFMHYGYLSLAENIWLGDILQKNEVDRIKNALDQADIGQLPETLPQGFKQLLSKSFDSERGTDLSGGQWQRIALARSFFRAANILILDEPTAAVDARAEYEIFQNIARNQSDKTTVIISHRFSTVRKAKKIFVLEHGRVIEHGSHSSLMKQNGQYKKLFDLQAEGYK